MKRKRAIKLMMSASGCGGRTIFAAVLDGFKYSKHAANQPAAAWLVTRAAIRSMQRDDPKTFSRCKKALKGMGVELHIETE